jgi:hypothetical protein
MFINESLNSFQFKCLQGLAMLQAMQAKILYLMQVVRIKELFTKSLGGGISLLLFSCVVNMTAAASYMLSGSMVYGMIPLFLLIYMIMMFVVCRSPQRLTDAVRTCIYCVLICNIKYQV